MIPHSMRPGAVEPPSGEFDLFEAMTSAMRCLLSCPTSFQREEWLSELAGYKQANPAMYKKAKAAALAEYNKPPIQETPDPYTQRKSIQEKLAQAKAEAPAECRGIKLVPKEEKAS